jgi:hypothetical protein
LEILGQRTPDRIRDVGLAALEHRQAGRLVGHRLEHQALHARDLAPVLIVGLEHQLYPRRERDELVRAGSHRRLLEPVIADLLDILLGHDPARAGSRRAVEGQEVRPRLLEAKANPLRIDDLDGGDACLEGS